MHQNKKAVFKEISMDLCLEIYENDVLFINQTLPYN